MKWKKAKLHLTPLCEKHEFIQENLLINHEAVGVPVGSMYKMITVLGGGHIDAITLAQAPAVLAQLIPGSSPTPHVTPTPIPPTTTVTSPPPIVDNTTPTVTSKPTTTSTTNPTSIPTATGAPAATNDPVATPAVPELSSFAIILLLIAVASVLIVATKRQGGKNLHHSSFFKTSKEILREGL